MSGPCILVVDDNPTNLKLVSDVLEFDGFRVLKAADAEVAQEIIEADRPDLILMDIALPGMDGLTLTRQLKANHRTRDIVIIALTASAMKGDDRRAREAGCDGYITKPFDTRSLAATVSGFLNLTSSRPESAAAQDIVAREGSVDAGPVERDAVADPMRIRKSLRILLVDDRPINLRVLRAQLEGEGHTIFEAANGVEALALLRRESVEVVISDILMPVMDGYRLCYEVRHDAHLHDLPFIFYAASRISAADRDLSMDVGADRHLEKPAPIEVLLQTIREAVAGPRRAAVVTERTADVLKEYSERLVKKLEERNIQLAQADDRMLLQTTALETAANAILITHIDGTIVWVNAAFTTTTGYTAEEAIGRTPRILKSGTHDQSTYQDLWETITSGRTWRGEFVNRRKNGSVYYDESTVTPVRASNGAITHFVSVMQDITERKQAEADLRASETWLRAIFEASRDGVLVEDDGVVVYASRSYKEMLGYDDAEDMVGWPVSRLLPPGEAERLTSYGVARLRGEPVPTVYEFLVRCKDGSVTDVEGAVSTFSIGGKQYVTTNIRNITDSKKALALAREQASLIDQAHDAIIVRDLAGRITFWNKGAERLFGFPAGDAMGSRFDELLKIDAGSFETATRTTIASGVWSGQVERTTATGQTVAVDASWTLMLDDHGQPKAIFSIDTNITDRKNLEKQFLRAQRLESLGTLAGGIAHDLNNLLMPIMMGVTLLKRLDPSARGLLAINNIERSVKRGTDLVKQVMLFARGVEGARTVIDLREIVSEVEAIAESTFPKNITFVTNMPARLSKVMGDATQLNQVLLNLCVNARDAMPSGGHITIDAEERTVDQQQAVLLGGVAGSYVVLEVADTGSGIPHEVLERIFEPFFTTKDIGKGTGLGLSTVQGIVRSHGGFIEVVSEAGIGSRFRVYLPPDAEAALPIVPELPIESLPRGHGEVILLVDDEVAILGITRQTLEEFGYTVLTAEDGAQAIGVYARDFRNIAVVITDMMMPVIDGAGLIAALRGINPNVIVIASSGHTDGNEMARATAAGATQFLWKPFGAEVMLQTLEQVLPHPGGTAIDPTPPLPVIAAA